MTLQQLQYFVTAAETLSFSEAAKRLYIAPSAVSYGIASLENDLGVRLFSRKKGAIALTQEGEVLYTEAGKILTQVNALYQKMNLFRGGQADELRIGFLASLLKPYFAELIVPFINRHSDIRLSMQPMNLDPMLMALQNGEIDVALTRSFHLENLDTQEIGSQKIYSDHLGLLVHESHPMAKLDVVEDMSQLKDEAFIMVDPKVSVSLYDVIIKLCARRNYVPKVKSIVPVMDSVFTQVAARMGISVVPCFDDYYRTIPGLRFIPIPGDDTTADVVVAWNKAHENPKIQTFLKSIFP